MAISGSKRNGVPTSQQNKEATEEKVKQNLSKSKVIDTRVVVDVDTAILKTKRYVDGSNWAVTYYNQFTTTNDTIGQVDSGIADVEQQYTKINNLVLKVTSPIESTNLSDMTGVATVVDFLPLVGDMFKATLIGDIDAIFTVTDIEEKSYNLDRVYDISFKLSSTMITDPVQFTLLDTRTVKEYHYDNTAIYSESDPLLLASDYYYKESMVDMRQHMEDQYRIKFQDDSKRGLLVLNTGLMILHDQCVCRLYNLISDRSSDTMFVDDLYENTIISLLLTGSPKYLSSATQLKYKAPPIGQDYSHRLRGLIGIHLTHIASETGIVIRPTHNVLPVFDESDESYLFSIDFYNNKENLSLIEELLLDVMMNKALEQDKVMMLVNASFEFTDTELYLYVPFIMLIMSSSINTTHSK